MSEPAPEDPRFAALRGASRRKAEAAEQAAVEALRLLRAQGQRVTVASVAREAGVSPAYLYGHKELRAQILGLSAAGRPGAALLAAPVGPSGMISVLHARIEAVEDERRQLRLRVRRLERDLAVAHGEIIELRSRYSGG